MKKLKIILSALLFFPAAFVYSQDVYNFNGTSSASTWSTLSYWTLNGSSIAAVPTGTAVYVTLSNSTAGATEAYMTINKAEASGSRSLYFYAGDEIETLNLYATNTGNSGYLLLDFSNITSGTINLAQAGTGLGVNKFGFVTMTAVNAGVTLNINGSYKADTLNTTHVDGTMNFNYSGSVKRLYGSGNISIGSGIALVATISGTSSTAFCLKGSNSYTNMASGSSFTITSGFRTQNADISGALTVNGAQYGYAALTDNIAFSILGKAVFRSAATVSQAYATSASARVYVMNGSLYTYAAESALSFAQALQLSNSTLVLNSANSIKSTVGGVTKTMLKISQYSNTAMDGVTSASIKLGVDADTGEILTVAKNTIGSIEFYGASTLDLLFNGNELEIDSVFQTESTSGDISINISDADTIYRALVLKDFLGLTDKSLVATYFTASVGDVLVEYVNGTDSADGYYVSTIIPEPAEWAAIFGAIAIGMALYRKRRSR